MKKQLFVLGLVVAAGLVAARGAWTGDLPTGAAIVAEADLKWEPAKGLPEGTQMAVLAGDPSKAGAFVIRLKFPAGWKVAAHTHPADEHVTVLSGAIAVGFGDAFDAAALKDVPTHGYCMIPAGARHFAQAKDGATIQVNGVGPWGVEYVEHGAHGGATR